MPDPGEERRRTARVAASEGSELTITRPHPVRLVEISMTGALLRTSIDPGVGQRGELRTRLGDHVFAAHVEIRRTVPQSGHGGYGESPGCYTIGVTFVSLDADNRRCLERFLRQPPSR